MTKLENRDFLGQNRGAATRFVRGKNLKIANHPIQALLYLDFIIMELYGYEIYNHFPIP